MINFHNSNYEKGSFHKKLLKQGKCPNPDFNDHTLDGLSIINTSSKPWAMTDSDIQNRKRRTSSADKVERKQGKTVLDLSSFKKVKPVSVQHSPKNAMTPNLNARKYLGEDREARCKSSGNRRLRSRKREKMEESLNLNHLQPWVVTSYHED